SPLAPNVTRCTPLARGLCCASRDKRRFALSSVPGEKSMALDKNMALDGVRKFLRLAAIAAAGLAAGAVASAASAETLNVGSYGGTIENWTKLYFKPFQDKTGNPVVASIWENNLAALDAMVKANNVSLDVVDVGAEAINKLCDSGL